MDLGALLLHLLRDEAFRGLGELQALVVVLERREADLDDLVTRHRDRLGELFRRHGHEVSSCLGVGLCPRAERSTKPHASS
eukprot:7818876-Alexandrium_andersonii.AAC.1